MLQAGRNLIDSESGAMCGKGYLILDRDTKYTDQFRRLIRGSGTNVIRLPPRSPNLKELVSYCTSLELLRSDSVRRFNVTPFCPKIRTTGGGRMTAWARCHRCYRFY
jgi:hypothetical protein